MDKFSDQSPIFIVRKLLIKDGKPTYPHTQSLQVGHLISEG